MSIQDMPTEILEKIFFHISPYVDLRNAMMVCMRWKEVGSSVLLFRQGRFRAGLEQTGAMTWTRLAPPERPPMGSDAPHNPYPISTTLTNQPSRRFGASLIYYENVLYMFGGATMQRTTFNDLWIFDLTMRRWSRVIPSTGTYPPPRACAVGVRYHNNLVIYGGFEHQTTSLIWVRSHWLNTAYVYNIPKNCWNHLHLNHKASGSGTNAGYGLPNSCGHSVCLIQRNRLLLFGGKIEDRRLNTTHLIDIGVGEWRLIEPVCGAVPAARFGHTAVALTEDKILMLGGDVCPNKHANDVWMLQVSIRDGIQSGGNCPDDEQWWWTPISSLPDASSIPPSLNYLSSVKVPGLDLVLILGSANPLLEDHLQRLHEKACEGARKRSNQENLDDGNKGEKCAVDNSYQADLLGRQHAMQERRRSVPPLVPQEDQNEALFQDHRGEGGLEPPGGRSPLVGIRRNSRADRQRRLRALQAEEDRLRDMRSHRQWQQHEPHAPQQLQNNRQQITSRKRPLCLYTLDVSNLLRTPIENNSGDPPSVRWKEVNPAGQDLENAPAERFGYPAVIGRQEIYVMGGLVTRGERSRRRFFVDNLLIDPMMQAETDPALFELSGDLFVCSPKVSSRNLT